MYRYQLRFHQRQFRFPLTLPSSFSLEVMGILFSQTPWMHLEHSCPGTFSFAPDVIFLCYGSEEALLSQTSALRITDSNGMWFKNGGVTLKLLSTERRGSNVSETDENKPKLKKKTLRNRKHLKIITIARKTRICKWCDRHFVAFLIYCSVLFWYLNVLRGHKAAKASRAASSLTQSHRDTQSVFTEPVYGFIAPHLRKSKQETNAPNNIPETSGKMQTAFSLCLLRRKGLQCKTHGGPHRATACRLPVLRTSCIIFTHEFAQPKIPKLT